MVRIGSGAKPAAKSQVILPKPSIPESDKTISDSLAAFDKMRRVKCPKCDKWEPDQEYCLEAITIGNAPMGKCPEFKKKQNPDIIPRCPTCGIMHPPPYCEKTTPKQEVHIPVTEISSLLKMARSRLIHHVPKCPHCGKCSPTFTWDGRLIRVYYNECKEAFDWDPSPSWAQIMIVEKWLSETRGSNGH